MKGLKDMKYVADGVYIGHDGFQVWATTGTLSGTSNIAFEPEAFVEFVAAASAMYEEKLGIDVASAVVNRLEGTVPASSR